MALLAPAPMDALLPPLSQWQGRGLVVGSGGIGMALLRALAQRAPRLELVGAGRRVRCFKYNAEKAHAFK